jgi:GNAT superfamily N-acetyltransferase
LTPRDRRKGKRGTEIIMALATARADQAQQAALSIRKAVTAEDISAISTVLTHAFFADPVFGWTFPDDDRRRNLDALNAVFARPYVRHGESYLTDDANGAALWLPPGEQLVSGDEEAEFVRELEETAGPDAGRLFELLEIFDRHHPEGTYRVLQLLAVEPAYQGRGIGAALIAPGLARSDLEGVPTYLEATTERSVPFYARHGFEGIGEIALPEGPSLYPMWREPSSP